MSWINKMVQFVWRWSVVPLCLLIAILGGAVLLVASPVGWSQLYQAPDGVSDFAQEDGGEIARNLWTETPYAEVSESLQGRKLIQREIDHYDDLQAKFGELLILVLVASVVSAFGLASKKRMGMILFSLVWLLAISAAGVIWSMVDWRDLFRTLHWWLFQDDSWILPWGCYSLELFPYSVWKKSMVFIVCFSLIVYGALLVGSRLTSKKLGAREE